MMVLVVVRRSRGQGCGHSAVAGGVAERRASKLVSLVASCFTGSYVRLWPAAMGPERSLHSTPLFDGRAVLYPSARHLRDYLSWRQADAHVNNQVPTKAVSLGRC